MGCSTEAAATRTLAEACCEPLYSFTRLACKSRSSFWLNLRPSLYREGLIREARDVWGSLSSGCGVRSGSGSLKNSQLYNIYYKKSGTRLGRLPPPSHTLARQAWSSPATHSRRGLAPS